MTTRKPAPSPPPTPAASEADPESPAAAPTSFQQANAQGRHLHDVAILSDVPSMHGGALGGKAAGVQLHDFLASLQDLGGAKYREGCIKLAGEGNSFTMKAHAEDRPTRTPAGLFQLREEQQGTAVAFCL